MRQRVITVPKDKASEKALDFDEATKDQLIELPIKEEDFLFMYQNGIIELINQEGGANIDDFEDDSIAGKENLNRVIQALNLKQGLVNSKRQLIQDILNLFEEALARGTGIYFYL